MESTGNTSIEILLNSPEVKERMKNLGIPAFEELKRIAVHLPKLEFEYFTCPDCGKKLTIFEAVEIKIQTESKHIGTKFHGRIVEHKYRESYYNVRFCPSCAKKRKYKSRVGLIILFIIIPLAISVSTLFSPSKSFDVFICSFFAGEFLCGVAYALWRSLTMGYSIDIEHAAKCNALAPNRHFDF